MVDSEILKEFQQPYLYMLSSKDEDKNEEYRYRLLSNIFLDTTYDPKHDPKYLYLFGIFPAIICRHHIYLLITNNYREILIEFLKIIVLRKVITKMYLNQNIQILKY